MNVVLGLGFFLLLLLFVFACLGFFFLVLFVLFVFLLGCFCCWLVGGGWGGG